MLTLVPVLTNIGTIGFITSTTGARHSIIDIIADTSTLQLLDVLVIINNNNIGTNTLVLLILAVLYYYW